MVMELSSRVLRAQRLRIRPCSAQPSCRTSAWGGSGDLAERSLSLLSETDHATSRDSLQPAHTGEVGGVGGA
jgi:hypothetical protein